MEQEAEKEILIEQQRKTISYYDENAEDFFERSVESEKKDERGHSGYHLCFAEFYPDFVLLCNPDLHVRIFQFYEL